MSDTPPQADPAADLTRAELARREYGKYRAVGPIRIGGALAFRKHDPVPVSHVTRGVVPEELVELIPEVDDDPIETFLARGADDVIADVGRLSDAERIAALTAEEAGKNRVTVLRALGRPDATGTTTTEEG